MSISKVSNAPKKKSTKDEGGLSAAGGAIMGGIGGGANMLAGGAGMLAGGVGAVGGALNPMQLLNAKKKKVKDTRQYRSRNDIEFSDCESLDEPSSGDEDEEEYISKTSLAYLRK